MPATPVACIVFDLDDTLWNTVDCLSAASEVQREALLELYPDAGDQYDQQGFKAEMQKSMALHPERAHDFTFLRQETLLRLTGSPDVAAKVYEAWFRKRNNPTLFPRVLETLRSLRDSGIKIGTLTDGNSDPMSMENGLPEVVDFCVSAAEAGAPKPDRRTFALCEEKAGLGPESMLMVGDNVDKDVVGAKLAGWRAVWCRPPRNGIVGSAFDLSGGRAADGEAEADAVVDHISEVAAVLAKM